jgi:uncharacterized glyoxalase superfamily protein PhnB
MEFLSRAFGFREVVRSLAPDDGRVWHAEMELEGARIYLGQPQRDYRNPNDARANARLGATLVNN